jgi:hypothetical protein
MIHGLTNALLFLAQLKPEALKGDPSLSSEPPSEIMPLLIGAVFLAGILVIAFRPAKRDRIEK